MTGRRRGGDRGIAVVFFAISVTAMLAVGALVLGGSIGYTAVRNAQTAADSAAIAGATALQEHKQNWKDTSAAALLTEIEEVVARNGAVLAPGGCELVSGEYGLDNDEAYVIGPCERIGVLSEDVFRTVAGIRVTVNDTRDVPFSSFVDRDDITGTAVAAATIQPVIEVAEGWSVFMLCTSPKAKGHPAQALEPNEDTEDPTDYSVRTEAHGKVFVLWGNEIKDHDSGRDCGKPSSDWRGLIQYDMKFPLPSTFSSAPLTADDNWWQITEGNASGTIDFSPNILGPDACELSGETLSDLELGCELAVPLCPFSNQGEEIPAPYNADPYTYSSDYRLFCPQMGIFEITHIGSTFTDSTTTSSSSTTTIPAYKTPCGVRQTNIICGRFQGSAVAKDGQGSADSPDQYAFVVIKLVE